jgi:uncharacterized RDD family membrane protein YckC
MEENTLQPEESGLANELNQFHQHIQASTGQRFLNWLIDNLLMQFGLSLLSGYIVGYILYAIAPDFLTQVAYEVEGTKTWRYWVLSFSIGYFNYIVYYTFCEKVFKGYTLGKAISRTRAIRDDGQELTFKDAFLRTLSRLVPFEVLSGFSDRPWHDSWTKTTVVKAR